MLVSSWSASITNSSLRDILDRLCQGMDPSVILEKNPYLAMCYRCPGTPVKDVPGLYDPHTPILPNVNAQHRCVPSTACCC
jgi:hypothetical protein